MSNLDDWQPPEAPPGFADRVMAARRAELDGAAKKRPRYAPAGLATGALAIAAIVGFLVFTRSGSAVGQGAIAPVARTTVKLGLRATAVAEPGTTLEWKIERGGDARVVQNAGDTFYRVEPGGAFVVATPAGDVTVTGTCFRVEVMSMRVSKDSMVGAVVGAALSAAVLVTVYEGHVILANERGKTEIAAGERATAATGGAPGPAVVMVKPGGPGAPDGKLTRIVVAPEPPPAAGATRDDLLARDALQRTELAKLRARVAELEAEEQKAGHPKILGDHGGDTASFINPTHDELVDMAKHCAVQYDSPPIGPQPFQLPPRLADSAGLTAEETARVNQALADMNGKIMAQLRALYVETTGNTSAAEDLTAMAMEREIEEKASQSVVAEAMKQLSAERAGLAPPPANLSATTPAERMLRLMQSVGDLTEQTIAGVVGPDRAHAMRAKNDGWGQRSKMAGCKDEDEPGAPPPQ